MKRSPPQERVVLKKLETTGKDLDDDKKYLVEWLKWKTWKETYILAYFYIDHLKSKNSI